jgi:hypothetical protein
LALVLGEGGAWSDRLRHQGTTQQG